MAATLNLNDSTRDVLLRAKSTGKVLAGNDRALKCIIRGKATLVLLANDCTDKKIAPAVTELCKNKDVDILTASRAKIGEAVGLVRYTAEGAVGKVVKTSTAALTIPREEAMVILQAASSA